MNEEKESIPILDLESFTFTPPGPMGWNFEIMEEDMINAKRGIQSIIEAEESLSLDGLVELSPKYVVEKQNDDHEFEKVVEAETIEILQDKIKETEEEEINKQAEEMDEEANDTLIEEKIKIILPDQPVKGPWLSSNQLSRFRK